MWAVWNEHWYSAEPQISVSPWKAEQGVDLLVWPSSSGSSGWSSSQGSAVRWALVAGGILWFCSPSVTWMKNIFMSLKVESCSSGLWNWSPLVGEGARDFHPGYRLQLNLLSPLPWPCCQALGLRSNCWGSPSSCSWPGSLQTCEVMWTPIFSPFFRSKLGFMAAFTKK